MSLISIYKAIMARNLKQFLQVLNICTVVLNKFWDWSTKRSECPFNSYKRKLWPFSSISSWIRFIYRLFKYRNGFNFICHDRWDMVWNDRANSFWMRPDLVLKFQIFRNKSIDTLFALIKWTEYNNKIGCEFFLNSQDASEGCTY